MLSRDRRPRHAALAQRAGFLLLAAIIAGGLASRQAVAAAISFAPPATYDVPGGGRITPVDLDGDGELDMVVTGPQGLYFFYGRGDGTFEPSTVIPMLTVGWTIAADMNGDGLPDMIAGQGN